MIDENKALINNATGVDLDYTNTIGNISLDQIVYTSLEKLPFKSNSFDVVISLWVLEHLRDPRTVFAEIYRVLKPGGIFLFVTPNKNYIPLLIMRFLNRFGINNYVNKVLFGREPADIFKTFYNANTLNKINKLSSNTYNVQELKYNFDPSYTSFNALTYKITKFTYSIKFISFFKAHIVGVLKK